MQDVRQGQDEMAVVERVVPGRLVYVTVKGDASTEQVFGFKLNQMVLRNADGSCRPYRGEPLSELGVTSGAPVVIWGLKHRDVEPTLVIDTDRPKSFSVTIGSSLSNAVTHTAATVLGKIIR
jgi:hypothetical protein